MDFSSGKNPMPSTHWTEGCVSHSPGLHRVEKIKSLSSVKKQTQIPQLSRPYPSYYTDSTIPVLSSSTKQNIFCNEIIIYPALCCIMHISNIYATVSQLPDDGQKIGQNMSYCKIRTKAILEVVLFNIYLTLYMKLDVKERQLQQQRLLSEEVPGLKVLYQ
jgi:hypothetical protein